ncbi:glutathione peroxidase [Flavobacteriaceae bacterium Ap0902]|nr:glutathione peroxidase [Flavobacteriaceae bacterium Ap0902]
MKKIIFLTFIGLLFMTCNKHTQVDTTSIPTSQLGKIYDYTVKDIDGDTFDFADLKGKKIMIVNTASKCGFTPQYAQLEEIYEKYKDDNFIIVGFPANNFLSQEPGSNEEIKQFCTLNYGVTFPMMEKISVKGDDKAPVYQFLTQKSANGVQDSEVQWNFQKYLIGEEGVLEHIFYSKVEPNDPEIIAWIEE